ncbi:hypothetical protein BVRB_4g083750 [Beta vulgaris subsp. vulgaris]|nr:hypothetical protein BVRB_4g083750 [Beta vulgaris subsp. vulgaris]
MEKKYFGFMLLLLFLFASEMNMVVEVDGAICGRKPSKFFDGPCIFAKSCKQECVRENWPEGKCISDFRCECQMYC